MRFASDAGTWGWLFGFVRVEMEGIDFSFSGALFYVTLSASLRFRITVAVGFRDQIDKQTYCHVVSYSHE
jgi:hypothetical protein